MSVSGFQAAGSATIAAAIGCAVGGWLGDRFGSKKTPALAYALTTVPTLMLAMQISAAGLQSLPTEGFYGLIIAHGLVFGMSKGACNAIYTIELLRA